MNLRKSALLAVSPLAFASLAHAQGAVYGMVTAQNLGGLTYNTVGYGTANTVTTSPVPRPIESSSLSPAFLPPSFSPSLLSRSPPPPPQLLRQYGHELPEMPPSFAASKWRPGPHSRNKRNKQPETRPEQACHRCARPSFRTSTPTLPSCCHHHYVHARTHY